jgi:hypothetical protein
MVNWFNNPYANSIGAVYNLCIATAMVPVMVVIVPMYQSVCLRTPALYIQENGGAKHPTHHMCIYDVYDRFNLSREPVGVVIDGLWAWS